MIPLLQYMCNGLASPADESKLATMHDNGLASPADESMLVRSFRPDNKALIRTRGRIENTTACGGIKNQHA